jgi:hypothetical protein
VAWAEAVAGRRRVVLAHDAGGGLGAGGREEQGRSRPASDGGGRAVVVLVFGAHRSCAEVAWAWAWLLTRAGSAGGVRARDAAGEASQGQAATRLGEMRKARCARSCWAVARAARRWGPAAVAR